jgi:hypothetical protein
VPSMLPQELDQFTGIFAANCCVCPGAVDAAAGVMLIGVVMVAVVEAVPLAAVAVMLHEPVVRGAVKDPVAALMAPHVAVQVTATLAENCCDAPSLTVGLEGVMAIAIAVPAVS